MNVSLLPRALIGCNESLKLTKIQPISKYFDIGCKAMLSAVFRYWLFGHNIISSGWLTDLEIISGDPHKTK
jgi:hypothetical protein